MRGAGPFGRDFYPMMNGDGCFSSSTLAAGAFGPASALGTRWQLPMADASPSMNDEKHPSLFIIDPERDRLLQLSTCTVPADPARRFVVTCAYVGEEEL